MTIKEIAFFAQERLRADTGVAFKRSHVHELLAASFGFNSLAALGVDTVLVNFPESFPESRVLKVHRPNAVIERCLALGYARDTATLAKSTLDSILKERRVGIVSISALVKRLSGEWSTHGYQSDGDENGPFYDADADEFDLTLLAGLEAAANRDNALAHYALALIHAPDDEDDEDDQDDEEVRNGDETGSSYWHSQRQQGRVLTGVQKEWADAHERRLARPDLYLHHLKAAVRLGYPDAGLEMAERTARKAYRGRLVRGAENGDTDAMLELIEGYDRGDLQRCWTWVYLAQLVGTDLSRDAHYLISEDGFDYDDDVGGPAYVQGHDGVRLEPLPPAQDESARRAAQKLFAKIRSTARR